VTIEIPIWLLWTLGIVGGAVGVFLLGAIAMYAWIGYSTAGVIGTWRGWR